MAPLVRTGGSRHTGLAALPHRNIQYLFIERYKNSDLKEIFRFANGLEKDLEAVENSVACELSNGFVEGTNSKLKMVKRTMYGRCSKALLAAKLMYVKAKRYG